MPNAGSKPLDSFPAHAGQSGFVVEIPSVAPGYPRACGAIGHVAHFASGGIGLSPRMRGNRADRLMGFRHPRAIPAHAGQSQARAIKVLGETGYPRACGAIGGTGRKKNALIGLSPRMRGNRWPSSTATPWVGAIPAHAGQSLPVNLLIRNGDFGSQNSNHHSETP